MPKLRYVNLKTSARKQKTCTEEKGKLQTLTSLSRQSDYHHNKYNLTVKQHFYLFSHTHTHPHTHTHTHTHTTTSLTTHMPKVPYNTVNRVCAEYRG